MLQESEKEILRNYITESEPFGPINASEIVEPIARRILFDVHNNLYQALHKRPSVVVGRKGSGKTTYLQSSYFDGTYDYIYDVDTSRALVGVIEAVERLSKGVLFAETVANLWETVLWIPMLTQLRQQLSSAVKNKIDAYLAKVGIRTEGTIDDVLWNIADTLAERAKDKPVGIISDILRRTDTISFSEVKQSVSDELKFKKKRAVILVDSLEDFHLNVESVAIAIQGLLKFVGRTNTPSSRVDIRFCIPAEQYYQFDSVSSNHNKDFRRELLLHWIAPELLAVAANRLLIYFELYEPDLFITHGSYSDFDSKNVGKLFDAIFPPTITSGLGVVEKPLAYVLRHTQLLPRHLIMILNAICARKNRYSKSTGFFLDEPSINKGIADVEEGITLEIFNAYQATHPKAKDVCTDCLPELQHKFSIGDLERVFRTHGKKAMGSNEFGDFKRMLIEIGAVGKVVGETEKYIQGSFEYTAHHKLVTCTDDELCLHPLFTEVFSAKTKLKKTVYPYGSVVDDKDYRDIHDA
jgi:hypothetical protein